MVLVDPAVDAMIGKVWQVWHSELALFHVNQRTDMGLF